MAATYTLTKVSAYSEANKRVRVYDVALSGTYTTGGDALTAAALGLKVVEEFIVHSSGASDGTVQYPVHYIYSSNKLKLWESGGAAGTAAAEKGSGESLTGISLRVTVRGY